MHFLANPIHSFLPPHLCACNIPAWNVLCCSVTNLSLSLCDPKDCRMPGFSVLHCLPEFAQTHVQSAGWVHWMSPTISSSVIPCSSCLQSSPASVFSNESALGIKWPKYWSFSFSISTSNEYSGLISLRMDWFDILAVQGTLKSLQHHHSKASTLLHSAIFTVQLSHPYLTPGKTIALTIWAFVCKVMSLLFNMLSSFVTAFLSSIFYFVAAVTVRSDFGAQEDKIWHCSHFFPICLPWSDGTRCHDLRFLNTAL